MKGHIYIGIFDEVIYNYDVVMVIHTQLAIAISISFLGIFENY